MKRKQKTEGGVDQPASDTKSKKQKKEHGKDVVKKNERPSQLNKDIQQQQPSTTTTNAEGGSGEKKGSMKTTSINRSALKSFLAKGRAKAASTNTSSSGSNTKTTTKATDPSPSKESTSEPSSNIPSNTTKPSHGPKQPKKKQKQPKNTDATSKNSTKDLPSSSSEVNDSTSSTNTSKLTPLQQQMQKKLAGAQFRWINEKLYTTESSNSLELFKEKPHLFDIYHEGFRTQVHHWPVNPIDVFISHLQKKPAGTVVADLGCGEAKIARTLMGGEGSDSNKKDAKGKKRKGDTTQEGLGITVHSFDLVAPNKYVTVADIAKVPLSSDSVDVAIFCLSLMGTNYMDFIREAHRILKSGGELKIAEVVSRLENVKEFIDALSNCGFRLRSKDDSNKMFILLEFRKIPMGGNRSNTSSANDSATASGDGNSSSGKKKRRSEHPRKGQGIAKAEKGEALLKPCLYKRR
ncbi:25S rRNA (adenine645-N1)-methyltransferase [Quaeritorhiza haematococci]|nr:25S rRNA (adenine645-N1)-methyltransferase [Quaeritorhiza haematococci]